MEVLAQAAGAVQKNIRALLIYLYITIPAGALIQVANLWARGNAEDWTGSPTAWVWQLGVHAFLVLAYSAAQTVAFARLGREIDRPLWRIADDREAIRRFFAVWLALNTVYLGCLDLSVWASAQLLSSQLAALFFALHVFVGATYVPVGVCIMVQGRFHWATLGPSVLPLLRQASQAVFVVLLNGLLLLLGLYFSSRLGDFGWVQPVLDVIFGYFDCLICAATWFLCIADREAPLDTDFDLF